MIENNVRMIWVQKQVIKCWFVTFGSFRVKSPKLMTVIFMSRIIGKQKQNDRKLCANVLNEKCSSFGLLSFLAGFRI